MLPRASSYEAVYGAFRWSIPARYNIARHVAESQPADAPALIVEDPRLGTRTWRFGEIDRFACRLANVLAGLGVGPGDRVAILLPQSLETALAHVAIYKLGAVALPLFTLFGEDALEYRLADSAARALVTDPANLPKVLAIRERLPALSTVLVTQGIDAPPAPLPPPAVDFWPAIERAQDAFATADTAADDPALLIYTSGTTGPPKGALHAHRTLLGHLPGVEFPHEFFPEPGDRFWTPADWAWAGGLLDVLLPAWAHGVAVVARRFAKFDPEDAFALMARHAVRNSFLPPTALKMMRQVPEPHRFGHRLRSVFSGGESLGAELIAWGREALGITLNEGYGQTECNLVLGNCSRIMPVKPGSMGRAVPGHRVEIVGEEGDVLPPGTAGQVAVHAPDPVMFLGYWRNPEATRRKFAGEWLLTGDTAVKDEDGYFHFIGRDDDLITSAGYRIGPSEIEDCLMKHPVVALAAAVGVPDPARTEVIKAFVVLRPGEAPSPALEQSIRDFVKTRLAAHEYPRMVEFVDELPMTATGKIRRRDLRDREVARQRGNGESAR